MAGVAGGKAEDQGAKAGGVEKATRTEKSKPKPANHLSPSRTRTNSNDPTKPSRLYRLSRGQSPEICRFLGIIIAMYYDEHNPPHFHARYGESKVEIAIGTLSVLAGKLPPRAMGLVMEWASRHQAELMADWELARQHAELNKIEPLE